MASTVHSSHPGVPSHALHLGRRLGLVAALVLSLTLGVLLGAGPASAETITVNANTSLGPSVVNTFMGLQENSPFTQNDLTLRQAYLDAGIKQARIYWVFDDRYPTGSKVVVTKPAGSNICPTGRTCINPDATICPVGQTCPSGSLFIDFAQWDTYINNLRTNWGITSFVFSVDFTPKDLSSNPTAPNYYNYPAVPVSCPVGSPCEGLVQGDWYKMVREFVNHNKNVLGISNGVYEALNEPELDLVVTGGNRFDQYMSLYYATAKAVNDSADSVGAQVGGPTPGSCTSTWNNGSFGTIPNYMQEFFLRVKTANARLNFADYHDYLNSNFSTCASQVDTYLTNVAWTAAWPKKFVTEWSAPYDQPAGCVPDPSIWIQGASRILENLIRETYPAPSLFPKSIDGADYYTYADDCFSSHSLLKASLNSYRKPHFASFQAIQRMSTGNYIGTTPDPGQLVRYVMATKDGSTVRALVNNGYSVISRPINVNFNCLPYNSDASVNVTVQRIDETHSNSGTGLETGTTTPRTLIGTSLNVDLGTVPFWGTALITITGTAGSGCSSSNLVQNPGLESGALAPWVVRAGSGSVVSGAGIPRTGTYALSVSGAGAYTEQVISGLTLGQQYTLGGWVKNDAGGGTVRIGLGYNSPVVQLDSAQVSGTTYTPVWVTFTPTTSTSINVYCWKDTGTSAGYCDDFTLIPEPVQNFGFESGALSPWVVKVGLGSVVTGQARTGTYALSVSASVPAESGRAYTEQVISGLTLGQQYTLGGWVKNDAAGGTVRIGLGYNSPVVSVDSAQVSGTTYTPVWVTFTPTTSTSINVYCWKDTGTSAGYCDDFTLMPS